MTIDALAWSVAETSARRRWMNRRFNGRLVVGGLLWVCMERLLGERA